MKISSDTCSGSGNVAVGPELTGYGSSKDAARADLMDKIAQQADAAPSPLCSTKSCPEGGSCGAVVKDSDLERNGTLTYARGGGRWLAWFNVQSGNSVNVTAACRCFPAA